MGPRRAVCPVGPWTQPPRTRRAHRTSGFNRNVRAVNRHGEHLTVIRYAQPSDGADLLILISEHVRYERAEVDVDADLIERLQTWVRQGRIEIFVVAQTQHAQEEPGLLGYAAVTRDVATWTGHEYAHLDCLFIREPARGRGIGTKLLTQVFERCREIGLSQIQWQTPTWNTPAIGFYERFGASHHPKQRFTNTLE